MDIVTDKQKILSKIEELYNQNKDFDNFTRISNYIKYCVDEFSYDNDFYKEERQKQKRGEVEEWNQEKLLFKLIDQKKGICDQFAKFLSLLSVYDYEQTYNKLKENDQKEIVSDKGFICNYMQCHMVRNGEEICHAINCIRFAGKLFFIDLSTLIHIKQGEYSSIQEDMDTDEAKFAFVDIETYLNNMRDLGIVIKNITQDKNPTSFIVNSEMMNLKSLVDDKKVSLKYYDIITNYDEMNKYSTNYHIPELKIKKHQETTFGDD